MKRFSLLLSGFFLIISDRSAHAQYASSNFSLIGHVDPETTYNADSLKYSGCWGWYQAEKNKEYGIACSHRGTYWIDITVPSSPTVSAYRQGKKSGCTWREAKTYKNYCYVISDDMGSNSFQIFDMKYLPDSVHKVYDGVHLFALGHTLWIDEDKLYIGSVTAGTSYSSMNVYSLANPTNPVLIRSLETDYPFIGLVHDMYVRRDTVYVSCGFQGMYVFDFTADTFSMIGSLTNYVFSGYNHSSAITPNGATMVFADEVPDGLPIKICDVTNVANIQVLATANQYPQTTPHNPFIPNNEFCFLSSYQDGLQLYDISNPSSPQLAGYFDTYPQGGGNVNNYPPNGTYRGQWGCYPFHPSGKIFALDRFNGAFILRTPLYNGPFIQITPQVPARACVGTSIVATALAQGANTVNWSAPELGITTAAGFSTSLSFSATGVFTVQITAANSGNTSSLIHTITVSTPPGASATSTNPTCGSCTDGAIAIAASGGSQPLSYSWLPAGGNSSVATSLGADCYTITITDAAGCTEDIEECLTAPSSGIQESSRHPFRIYPNPAKDKLSINIYVPTEQFTVHTLLGEKVLSGEILKTPHVLDISTLPKGLYILSLFGETTRYAGTFVVAE